MPNAKNVQEVKELETKLDNSSAVFLADYTGLSVNDQVTLRSQVEEAGGELRVTKNRLLAIALKNKGLDPTLIASDLKGPNMTLFASSDAVSPLKAIVEFAKKTEIAKPALKAGFLNNELLTLDKIKQLASLPSKNELIAKLLGTLTNPARNLVGILSAPTRQLVYALNAIATKDNK